MGQSASSPVAFFGGAPTPSTCNESNGLLRSSLQHAHSSKTSMVALPTMLREPCTPFTESRTHRVAADLACRIAADPFEIPVIALRPSPFMASAIETRLVSPSARDFFVSRVPRRVLADRPIELELTAVGLSADSDAAVSILSWISAHVRLHISVKVPGQPRAVVSLSVSVRVSRGGCIIRALARPAAWADAASVTVVSLALAGIPMSSMCLPATLEIGYNHIPAPAGAVYAAARAGDVPALQDALDAGGSTEEADEDNCTASFWAACNGHLKALHTLLAAGANPAVASTAGWTPLHAAASWNHASVVALLLATPGVDPIATSTYGKTLQYGKTPLDLAQSGGKVTAAALLQADPRVASAAASRSWLGGLWR